MAGRQGQVPSLRRRSLRERLTVAVLHRFFLLTRPMTLGVRAAAFDGEGRVFLVRHAYVSGWQLPGGGVESGETVEDALRKELREEGNLVLDDAPRLVSVHFNRAASRRDHVLFYHCPLVTQTVAKDPDREIAEAGFFAPDDLPAATTPATIKRLSELAGSEVSPHW